MIKRIVKLHFKREHVEAFKLIFESSKQLIQAREGCLSLELVQDTEDTGIFFTISIWNKEEDLAAYRNSDLFIKIWKKTKILFEDRAEAWTTKSISYLK